MLNPVSNISQVLAIVTDNATNNDTMLSEMETVLGHFSANQNRVRCVAHIMHLAVTDFLSVLKSGALEDNETEVMDPVGSPVNKVNAKFHSF